MDGGRWAFVLQWLFRNVVLSSTSRVLINQKMMNKGRESAQSEMIFGDSDEGAPFPISIGIFFLF
jgi:hypothetical protein